MSLLTLSPVEFADWLIEKNISRAWIVYDKSRRHYRASHPGLQSIANFLDTDKRDAAQHEGIFWQVNKEFKTLIGAFLHRTCRGQGAGGIRYWHYADVESYLRDGLRLSKGMTHKNAMAGIWWGGGKGVMSHNPGVDYQDKEIRHELYADYGRFMSSLKGCYITAEDVGTTVEDMAAIFSRTRFTTCIPPALGGSGNPSRPTAQGVVAGIEAALSYLGDHGGVSGKRIAIQGAGNVAGFLIDCLLERSVGSIICSDIEPSRIKNARQRFNDERIEFQLQAAGDLSLFETQSDVFSPCAIGATLNSSSIAKLNCRIVCGAANNQLEDPEKHDQQLFERKILYIPDFLVNRMGIVTCADEGAGYVDEDPLIHQHLNKDWPHSIHQMSLKVLTQSQQNGQPAGQVAVDIANQFAAKLHPIFGHRGQRIIDSLVAGHWENQKI